MDLYDLQTPCFIFDEDEFGRGVNGFRDALQSEFGKVSIGYSVKTNSLPYAMRKAREHGCMAEVVSHDEYILARLCGYLPHEIIYNGPMKSKETFLEAVSGGAVVNLESWREFGWLGELPSDGQFNIGIRLNINISHVSPEDADGDDDNSRFGFSEESGEFAEALARLEGLPNVRIAGLHIHRTTHSRLPRFYERSVAYAAGVVHKYGLALDYLDVGGGYFGIFPGKPVFADYAAAIHASLARHGMEGLHVIVEPGNALVASPFAFLTEVIDIKRIGGGTVFATTDGSRNDIDPFFRKSGYMSEIIRKDGLRPTVPLQVISGCTCLEYDRLFSLSGQEALSVGDRIMYRNVGAYTMTLSPQFIRLWPRVYAVDGAGTCFEVRRSGRASDIELLDK